MKKGLIIIMMFLTFLAIAEGVEKKADASTLTTEEIKEPALEMESWMTNDSVWTVRETKFILDEEKPLTIEEWMIDKKVWK